MKEKILELRSQGKTYNEIKKELGCAKSTVAYHCGDGQKMKAKNRTAKNRKLLKSKIIKKICAFSRNKIRNFKRGFSYGTTGSLINYNEAFLKIIETKKCYLTGRDLDIEGNNYQLDHIVPISKNGSNEITNMGIVCRDANMAKNDMTVDEFIGLCKEVLVNFGYEVNKKMTL